MWTVSEHDCNYVHISDIRKRKRNQVILHLYIRQHKKSRCFMKPVIRPNLRYLIKHVGFDFVPGTVFVLSWNRAGPKTFKQMFLVPLFTLPGSHILAFDVYDFIFKIYINLQSYYKVNLEKKILVATKQDNKYIFYKCISKIISMCIIIIVHILARPVSKTIVRISRNKRLFYARVAFLQALASISSTPSTASGLKTPASRPARRHLNHLPPVFVITIILTNIIEK